MGTWPHQSGQKFCKSFRNQNSEMLLSSIKNNITYVCIYIFFFSFLATKTSPRLATDPSSWLWACLSTALQVHRSYKRSAWCGWRLLIPQYIFPNCKCNCVRQISKICCFTEMFFLLNLIFLISTRMSFGLLHIQ